MWLTHAPVWCLLLTWSCVALATSPGCTPLSWTPQLLVTEFKDCITNPDVYLPGVRVNSDVIWPDASTLTTKHVCSTELYNMQALAEDASVDTTHVKVVAAPRLWRAGFHNLGDVLLYRIPVVDSDSHVVVDITWHSNNTMVALLSADQPPRYTWTLSSNCISSVHSTVADLVVLLNSSSSLQLNNYGSSEFVYLALVAVGPMEPKSATSLALKTPWHLRVQLVISGYMELTITVTCWVAAVSTATAAWCVSSKRVACLQRVRAPRCCHRHPKPDWLLELMSARAGPGGHPQSFRSEVESVHAATMAASPLDFRVALRAARSLPDAAHHLHQTLVDVLSQPHAIRPSQLSHIEGIACTLRPLILPMVVSLCSTLTAAVPTTTDASGPAFVKAQQIVGAARQVAFTAHVCHRGVYDLLHTIRQMAPAVVSDPCVRATRFSTRLQGLLHAIANLHAARLAMDLQVAAVKSLANQAIDVITSGGADRRRAPIALLNLRLAGDRLHAWLAGEVTNFAKTLGELRNYLTTLQTISATDPVLVAEVVLISSAKLAAISAAKEFRIAVLRNVTHLLRFQDVSSTIQSVRVPRTHSSSSIVSTAGRMSTSSTSPSSSISATSKASSPTSAEGTHAPKPQPVSALAAAPAPAATNTGSSRPMVGMKLARKVMVSPATMQVFQDQSERLLTTVDEVEDDDIVEESKSTAAQAKPHAPRASGAGAAAGAAPTAEDTAVANSPLLKPASSQHMSLYSLAASLRLIGRLHSKRLAGASVSKTIMEPVQPPTDATLPVHELVSALQVHLSADVLMPLVDLIRSERLLLISSTKSWIGNSIKQMRPNLLGCWEQLQQCVDSVLEAVEAAERYESQGGQAVHSMMSLTTADIEYVAKSTNMQDAVNFLVDYSVLEACLNGCQALMLAAPNIVASAMEKASAAVQTLRDSPAVSPSQCLQAMLFAEQVLELGQQLYWSVDGLSSTSQLTMHIASSDLLSPDALHIFAAKAAAKAQADLSVTISKLRKCLPLVETRICAMLTQLLTGEMKAPPPSARGPVTPRTRSSFSFGKRKPPPLVASPEDGTEVKPGSEPAAAAKGTPDGPELPDMNEPIDDVEPGDRWLPMHAGHNTVEAAAKALADGPLGSGRQLHDENMHLLFGLVDPALRFQEISIRLAAVREELTAVATANVVTKETMEAAVRDGTLERLMQQATHYAAFSTAPCMQCVRALPARLDNCVQIAIDEVHNAVQFMLLYSDASDMSASARSIGSADGVEGSPQSLHVLRCARETLVVCDMTTAAVTEHVKTGMHVVSLVQTVQSLVPQARLSLTSFTRSSLDLTKWSSNTTIESNITALRTQALSLVNLGTQGELAFSLQRDSVSDMRDIVNLVLILETDVRITTEAAMHRIAATVSFRKLQQGFRLVQLSPSMQTLLKIPRYIAYGLAHRTAALLCTVPLLLLDIVLLNLCLPWTPPMAVIHAAVGDGLHDWVATVAGAILSFWSMIVERLNVWNSAAWSCDSLAFGIMPCLLLLAAWVLRTIAQRHYAIRLTAIIRRAEVRLVVPVWLRWLQLPLSAVFKHLADVQATLSLYLMQFVLAITVQSGLLAAYQSQQSCSSLGAFLVSSWCGTAIVLLVNVFAFASVVPGYAGMSLRHGMQLHRRHTTLTAAELAASRHSTAARVSQFEARFDQWTSAIWRVILGTGGVWTREMVVSHDIIEKASLCSYLQDASNFHEETLEVLGTANSLAWLLIPGGMVLCKLQEMSNRRVAWDYTFVQWLWHFMGWTAPAASDRHGLHDSKELHPSNHGATRAIPWGCNILIWCGIIVCAYGYGFGFSLVLAILLLQWLAAIGLDCFPPIAELLSGVL